MTTMIKIIPLWIGLSNQKTASINKQRKRKYFLKRIFSRNKKNHIDNGIIF